jgi:hypothetical protein
VSSHNDLWQHAPMIVSSEHLGVWIDLGNNKPGMT